jgi:hypothetical protein
VLFTVVMYGGATMSNVTLDDALFWLNDRARRAASVHAEVRVALGDREFAVISIDGGPRHWSVAGSAGSQSVLRDDLAGSYRIGESASAGINVSDLPHDAEATIRDELGELVLALSEGVQRIVAETSDPPCHRPS